VGTLEIEGASAQEGTIGYSGERNREAVFKPLSGGRTYYLAGGKSLRVDNANGTTENYERVERARPAAEEVGELAGAYSSDEAETVLDVAVNGSTLVVKRRPDTTIPLRPIYKDAFSGPGLGLVRFRRDAAGKVVALSVVVDRVWDLRFERRR
jgi:hypothetical protein